MERIYLIKNPSIWMIDELIVFSQHVKFKILFIRKPGEFYADRLEQLKSNGIEIVCAPFVYTLNFSKILFCIGFVLRNLSCFFSRYSLVVGLKSMWWFLWLDGQHFSKPVSIHAQFATQPALIALLLKKYLHRQQVDYFITFHAYDIFFSNRWFVKLINNSSKSFSISEYNIDYVLTKYKGLNPNKIVLSRLGAFAGGLPAVPPAESGTFKIGFLSWFVEKKGLRYLLQAMQEIATSNKNIKLILAGDGPLKDEVQQFIELNNLQDTISYKGRIDAEGKVCFFSEIDAFVLPAITLPNDQDGIPVVLMEALSYGLPLISTNISGIPEICINHYNGFLIPEKNVAALVEAITGLYSEKAIASAFSGNSLQLFQKYRIEHNSLDKLKTLEWIT